MFSCEIPILQNSVHSPLLFPSIWFSFSFRIFSSFIFSSFRIFSFDKLFIKKDIPDEIPECTITSNIKVIDLITDNALVGSRGDAKRLIKQGAVSLDGNKVDDINFEISESENPQILKAGKRKFIKIV